MRCLIVSFLLSALCCTSVLAASAGKQTLGWIESVLLDRKLGLKFEAKLDTGADSSSLDARNIRRVRVGEKSYVRFSVKEPVTGEILDLRKPYVRRIRIKRHGGHFQRRYVVRMRVCVGDESHSIDVNLIDREHFDYPMLLGRSALEGWAVVDPSLARTVEPTCWPSMLDEVSSTEGGEANDDAAADGDQSEAMKEPETDNKTGEDEHGKAVGERATGSVTPADEAPADETAMDPATVPPDDKPASDQGDVPAPADGPGQDTGQPGKVVEPVAVTTGR